MLSPKHSSLLFHLPPSDLPNGGISGCISCKNSPDLQSRGQAGRGNALLRTDKFLQRFLEPGGCSDWQSSTAKLGRDTALVKRAASECSRENWVKIFLKTGARCSPPCHSKQHPGRAGGEQGQRDSALREARHNGRVRHDGAVREGM